MQCIKVRKQCVYQFLSKFHLEIPFEEKSTEGEGEGEGEYTK
jgi:hypothetical protein